MKYDITFHPSWWYKNAGISFLRDFFDEPEYRMDCDIKMRRTLYEHFGDYGLGEKNPPKRPLLGSDLLAAGYLHSQIVGCKVIYAEDSSPQVLCRNLNEEEIADIKAPDLNTNPVWKNTQRQIEYLLDKYGHVETYINLMGIQNIAMDLMGEQALIAYYSAPDEIESLLGEITKLSVDIGKRLKKLSNDISGGVTSIVRKTISENYLTSNCSVEMISNELYEEFLLKYDQELADNFGSFGIHHCGQTMEHVTAGYSKIRGLRFAEVGAFSNIRQVREQLPEVFLNARYSPARLMNASAEDVKKEVQNLVEEGNNEANQLSVSCVGLDHNITDMQVRNFLDACKSVDY